MRCDLNIINELLLLLLLLLLLFTDYYPAHGLNAYLVQEHFNGDLALIICSTSLERVTCILNKISRGRCYSIVMS